MTLYSDLFVKRYRYNQYTHSMAMVLEKIIIPNGCGANTSTNRCTKKVTQTLTPDSKIRRDNTMAEIITLILFHGKGST